jgi:GT2 family glycosyltransferase
VRASVIIPTWNGRDDLAICLDSLARQSAAWGEEFEVVVVDDGSTDGTPEWLAEDWPQARTVALQRNSGFAAACNRGFDAARGELLVLLNNDTEADGEFVATMIEAAAAHPEVACFAGLMLEHGQPETVNAAGLRISRRADCRALLRRQPLSLVPDRPLEVFGPSGGAAAYRRQLLQRVGTFDEGYFAYWEDADLTARIVWAGERCLLIPRARVLHREGASMSSRSALKRKLNLRNRLRFIERVWPDEWMGGFANWWSWRGRPWLRHGWKLWQARGRAVGAAFREFEAERASLARARRRIARDRAITLEQFASRLDDPPWLQP